jgi:hypothetical protein
MKIGVMTFWWSEDNYGQILQCYALQKYLRDAGHDAYLIRYDSRNDKIRMPFLVNISMVLNPVTLYNFLKYRIRMKIDMWEKRNNPRRFSEFREKYIKQSEKVYYSYAELRDNPPEADVYIAGSDQIWNIWMMPIARAENIIRAYCLDFGGPAVKRMAYAASFGKTNFDSSSVRIFSPLMKKFDYISVREKSGVEICKQCGVTDAEWVIDPALLLDAAVYRGLYSGEPIRQPGKPYCLLYILGHKLDFSFKRVYNWAKNKNLEVIYVTGNAKHDAHRKYHATIPEWLYLIDHAEYVITNSYHGAIFSLIFQKKFQVIPVKGKEKGMNGRFDSLFEILAIELESTKKYFSIIDSSLYWPDISRKLRTQRKIDKKCMPC